MPDNKKIQNLLKDASNLPKDKWLESYADGGEVDNNIDVTKAKEYATGWYNSPMYKSILTEQYGERTAKNKTKQANYFSDYYDVNPTLKSDLKPYGKNVPKGNKRDILLKTKFVQDNPTLVNSLFAHELLHDEMMTDKDRQKIISNTPEKELNNYIANPEEVRSQIHAIRQLGQENKVYDPFTQKFEKDYLQKIDTLFNQAKDADKNYNQLQRLRKIYTDDQIIDMMNTISKTNSNDKATYARFGGKLKKYQEGGETNNINQNNNQIYTYKTNPNYFDNKAVIHENPKYNELIKKSIYAGTHGYNPSTGELIKLKNKIEVPQETQLISTKEYGKASEKERFAVNPELRKQYIQKSTKEAYENPLMSAPGIIGMGPLAGPGFEVAYGLSGALSNLAAGNYGTAGLMGGLSALPFLRNAKILTKPKKLTSSVDNVIENTNNQLPPPPSEIQFMPDGTTRTVYNQQPITDYVSGSYRPDYINLRRLINEHVPSELNIRTASSEEIERFANRIGMSVDDFTRFAKSSLPRNINNLNKLQKPTNRSGLSKEQIIEKASGKNKDAISKMSDSEFENTVLKPTGEIVPYESQADLMPHFTGSNNVFAMSPKEYADEFNLKLDLLNDIIAQRNKSGVEYRVKGLDESGILTFYTPPGQKGKNPLIKKGLEDIEIPAGESIWSVGINPGEWRGNVEDIANTQYFRSIPGLEMRNTINTVFSDGVPRKGTGAYESINEYLKKLDLGRVKPGFNSQTEFSRGAWENFIKTGRGVGFYNNPRTIYGTMKNLLLPVVGTGIIGSELMKEEKPKQKLSQGGKVTKFGLSDKFNEIFKSEYSKGGYNLDKKASKLKDSFKPKFHTVDKNVPKSKSTDFEMYMRNYQHGGRLIPTSDRPIFDLKYGDGGKTKPSFEEYYKTIPQEKNDTSNYDLRRAFKELPYSQLQKFAQGKDHLPDTYKLPNHPTFSDESIYFNPKTKKYAGHWTETDSSWNYIPYNPAIKDIVIEKKSKGGKVTFSTDGEKHVVYKKESPTGMGKGKEGHIMVNHPTKDKGKWDTIDLTEKANAKTVAQGVAATKKWHKENPMEKYAKGGKTDKYVAERDATSTVKTPAIATNPDAFKQKVNKENPIWDITKYAIDAASLSGNPYAIAASSLMDAYEGDYSGAVLGTIPVLKLGGKHGNLWAKGYTKAVNAGVPHKYAFPIKRYGKRALIGSTYATQAADVKSDLIDPLTKIKKSNGGWLDKI